MTLFLRSPFSSKEIGPSRLSGSLTAWIASRTRAVIGLPASASFLTAAMMTSAPV